MHSPPVVVEKNFPFIPTTTVTAEERHVDHLMSRLEMANALRAYIHI